MTNKSFRIKNKKNEHATIWHVGEDYYSVLWDSNGPTMTYHKGFVESFLFRGDWTILPEQEEASQDETLPRAFKYYHVEEGPNKVNTWSSSGITTLWTGEQVDWWDAERAEDFIKNRVWIVLPSEDTIVLHSGPEKEHEQDLLEYIKEFTKQGHDVVISAGAYHVYPVGADNPYICPDEESLLEVMGAIETLDSYGG